MRFDELDARDVPAWQKRGIGFGWRGVPVEGVDPRTGQRVSAVRRRLVVDHELPMRDAYGKYVGAMLDDRGTPAGSGSAAGLDA